MNTHRSNLVTFFIFCGSLYGAMATAATSPVYVSSRVDLPAGELTYFAPRGTGPEVVRGTLSAVGASTVTDQTALWPDGLFSNGDYILQITSGDQEGLTTPILATTGLSGTLTLVDNLSALSPAVTAGATYSIRKAVTLEDLFGADNSAGLTSGTTAGAADQVLLFNSLTQSADIYFYKDTVGWRDAGDSEDAAQQAIQPYEAVIVDRLDGADLALHFQHQLQPNGLLLPIRTGFNILGTQRSAVTMTLATSGLEGLVTGGFNTSVADVVSRINPVTGQIDRYFLFDSGTGFTQWMTPKYQNANSIPLPPGDVIFIDRKGDAREWFVPSDLN